MNNNNFAGKMNQYDPNGVFMNNFGRRLKGVGTTMDVDPAATRCALLDYCFCSTSADCGPSQTCASFPNIPQMRTCRTPQDNAVLGTMPNYNLNLDNSVPFSLSDIITALAPLQTVAQAVCLLNP